MEAFDQISKDYLHLCQQLHGGYLTADAIIPANEKFTKLTKILASVAKTAEDLNCLDSKYRVEKQLARGIRSMAIRYYENNRILPTPPSMKKYLQKQRVRVINEKRRKFQREREGQGNSNKNLQLDSFVSKHKGGEASSATGSIDQNSNGIDPIQQQIDYVSNLIYEAEAQGRTDEMKLLQQNLQSLMNFQENSSVTSESTTNSCVGIGFGVEKDLIFFKINCPPKNTKKNILMN